MLFCLIDHLNITTSDTLFVAIRDIVDDEFHLGLQLQKEYPQLNIRLIPLRYDTIGATETLFLVHQVRILHGCKSPEMVVIGADARCILS